MSEHQPDANVVQLPISSFREGDLTDADVFWRDHQHWLEEKGYILRQRYHTKWVPSWIADPTIMRAMSEDGRPNIKGGFVLDAIRISDGKLVTLKRIYTQEHSSEMVIGSFLASSVQATSPGNHTVPLYDILQVPDSPDHAIIVMPFLMDFYCLQFVTLGEIVEFIRQIFEGLQFMHSNNIAHCDIKYNNVLSDTVHLYDPCPHPASSGGLSFDFIGGSEPRWTRTNRPVKHYLIDFGISRYYPEGVPRLHETGFGGVFSEVPEFNNHPDTLCNPFAVDVFCMGHLIRTMLQVGGIMSGSAYRGLEFMDDLIREMIQEDPRLRPTMDEVLKRFNDIVEDRLDERKLRSRAVPINDPLSLWTRFLDLLHSFLYRK